MEVLLTKVGAALPVAERYLDQLAEEAIAEATRVSLNPAPLVALVHNTRTLSS